jgi:DeoR family transcriptional regulator of aga operon
MVAHAQRTIVVADGSKVGRVTFANVAACDQIQDFVTDSTADPDALEELRAAGVRVHVADL